MEEKKMNIKKFYETLARIISEREQVKVTVTVKEAERGSNGIDNGMPEAV